MILTPRDVRRDAKLIAALDKPFTRWAEHTEAAQRAYIAKAFRVREHLATYEGEAK